MSLPTLASGLAFYPFLECKHPLASTQPHSGVFLEVSKQRGFLFFPCQHGSHEWSRRSLPRPHFPLLLFGWSPCRDWGSNGAEQLPLVSQHPSRGDHYINSPKAHRYSKLQSFLTMRLLSQWAQIWKPCPRVLS